MPPSQMPQSCAATPKPRLRGWIHAVTAPVMLVATLTLMVFAQSSLSRLGLVIYALSAVIMFGNSAVYHIVAWSPKVKALFRRLDHSFIFVFIAGTYTPLCLSLLEGTSRVVLLALVWSCAVLGLLFRVLWLSAPRALYTALYVAMGWAAVGWMGAFWSKGGPAVVILMIVGGLIYTLGALVYGRKAPNPSPTWFGFHEIFHSCTVIAALCHLIAIWFAVL